MKILETKTYKISAGNWWSNAPVIGIIETRPLNFKDGEEMFSPEKKSVVRIMEQNGHKLYVVNEMDLEGDPLVVPDIFVKEFKPMGA